MSNSLAIAVVTAAIRQRIQNSLISSAPVGTPGDFDINSARVTSFPPDRIRSDNKKVNQVNVHLYKVAPNAALRNTDLLPASATGVGPLALDLYYLVSAHGPADDELPSQLMLGQALRILHERPLFGPAELRDAIPGANTTYPFEAVRVAPHPLSLEDLSKLWAMYQTPARVAAAYCASLVLLEPATPQRSALPVLRRNLAVRPDTFAYPAIDELALPQARPFALLGDELTIRGHLLRAAQVRVRLQHPRLTSPIDLTPTTIRDTELRVALPNNPKTLPAGLYSLQVRLTDGSVDRTTDTTFLAVAPELLTGLPATTSAGAKLNLTVRPDLQPGQRVALLLGDREVAVSQGPTPKDLTLTVPAVPPGAYHVRLRVDDVESDILDRTASPPAFLATRDLRIQ